MFKIIVCLNKKGAIGNDGKLLYHIKNDSSNFKSITSGNVVIMGRKTFESLPKKSPFPNRVNIIITSDENYCVEASENVYIVHSVKDAVEMSKSLFSDKEVFVIGGESIYKQFLNSGEVSEMFLTIVHDETDGDTHFPQYNADEWKTYYKSSVQKDGDLEFEFTILKRK